MSELAEMERHLAILRTAIQWPPFRSDEYQSSGIYQVPSGIKMQNAKIVVSNTQKYIKTLEEGSEKMVIAMNYLQLAKKISLIYVECVIEENNKEGRKVDGRFFC